ncbi:MAG: T9SS type A sorting domain-containing protein [Bacteroidetes bacterium]|nr:T9SS type A sorting domain-containing protein [Bacteroidota bacterium]
MIKYLLTILILTTLATFSSGQNLVPNPSFETYSSCPTSMGQINYATSWINPTVGGSPDYFNACSSSSYVSVPSQSFGSFSSFQYAYSGNAYAAIVAYGSTISNEREYLQTTLTSTLSSGKCYYVSFYVNQVDYSGLACNNIGAYFSPNPINNPNPAPSYILNYPAQIKKFNNPIIKDTAKWVLVSGIYQANGNELYITIGNFNTDNTTDSLTYNFSALDCIESYYYIDNISVIPVDSIFGGLNAFAGNDTSIVIGDSVFIGQEISNLNCTWYIGSTIITNSVSGIFVSPTVTTTYIVEQNLCGVITHDTINVNVLPVGINENSLTSRFKLFPNPFTNVATFQFDNFTKQNCTLTLFDLCGQAVRTIKNITVDKVEIERQNLANGFYFYKLSTDKQIIATGKLAIE